MLIKETIERECCHFHKDLKRVTVEHFENCCFCIHCGQWWLDPESKDPFEMVPRSSTFKKLFPRL